jgi:hypothetical protein
LINAYKAGCWLLLLKQKTPSTADVTGAVSLQSLLDYRTEYLILIYKHTCIKIKLQELFICPKLVFLEVAFKYFMV